MNKEQKVISQPLAKKIHDKAKEKGFELPESNWYWGSDKKLYYRFDKSMIDFDQQVLVKKSYFKDDFKWCQTFDIAELREMIGKKMIETYMNAGKVSVMSYGHPQFDEDTFAEAMGKMFYYLLKNNLI